MKPRTSTIGKTRLSLAPRDVSHVYKPTHAHRFPPKESENDDGMPDIARPAEPVDTPDLLLNVPPDLSDEDVPAAIEPPPEDWLDADAIR